MGRVLSCWLSHHPDSVSSWDDDDSTTTSRGTLTVRRGRDGVRVRASRASYRTLTTRHRSCLAFLTNRRSSRTTTSLASILQFPSGTESIFRDLRYHFTSICLLKNAPATTTTTCWIHRHNALRKSVDFGTFHFNGYGAMWCLPGSPITSPPHQKEFRHNIRSFRTEATLDGSTPRTEDNT